MAHIQAFVVITLLIWAAVSVSGTTTELSTTAGDTVNIACLFGDGTVDNIYWYYNNGTGRQKLLFLAKRNITLGAEYENRASLQDDNSTLILKDITVADEGTYCCDVDRQGQTAVTNIETNLNVFSLRPDTLPKITPCSGVDESSSCSIHRKQSFTFTCTLANIYPVEDTELIWYQDGKRVLSTDNITQNDDGTTDISRQIQVSKTGNFTCNATYLSVNGKENTVASVEAWIMLPVDVQTPSGKNLTKGQIAGITIGLLVVIFLVTMAVVIFRRKSCEGFIRVPKDDISNTQPDEEPSSPLTTITTTATTPATDSTTAAATIPAATTPTTDPTNTTAATTTAATTPATPATDSTTTSATTTTDPATTACTSATSPQKDLLPCTENFDDNLVKVARKVRKDSEIDALGKNMDFSTEDIQGYIATNHSTQHVTYEGTLLMLRDWRKGQKNSTEGGALKTALEQSGQIRLADDLFPSSQ